MAPEKTSIAMSLKTQIRTAHFSQTQSFYEVVFGMVVIEEWDETESGGSKDKGVILGFPSGKQEAFLEIYASETPQSFDGLSLQFKVESMADFVAGLSLDIKTEGPVTRPWGAAYLYLNDPNNIEVIAYEGHE